MEQKHVALLIIGVVALIAVIGLIMHFNAAKTGEVARGGYAIPLPPQPSAEPAKRMSDFTGQLPGYEPVYRRTLPAYCDTNPNHKGCQ
jgi:hypothetical protein